MVYLLLDWGRNMTDAAFLFDKNIFMYDVTDGVACELTSYIVDDIKIEYGITETNLLSRIATAGTMEFTLDNSSGLFSPGTGNPAYKLNVGAIIQFGTRAESPTPPSEYNKGFYGRISSISFKGETAETRRINITATDYMDYLATAKLVSPLVETNKRADEAITSILATLPIQPYATAFDPGNKTFTSVKDTVTEDTTVFSEIQRYVLSEFGYFYENHFGSGTTSHNFMRLSFEDRHARNNRTPSYYVKLKELSSYLITEDGNYLVTDFGDLYLVADEITSLVYSTMEGSEITFGKLLKNSITAKVYPRLVDTSNVVIFSLNSPIAIAAGETLSGLEGSYSDPNNKAQAVAGMTFVDPVITTDYLLNTQADGLGVDLSATAVVTAVYTSTKVTYSITNGSANAGYITKLQARGKAVYLYDPVSYTALDQPSINRYGLQDITIDQKYEDNPYSSKDLVDALLPLNVAGVVNTLSVSGLANISKEVLNGFCQLIIGDVLEIIDPVNNTDKNYFINGIKYRIDMGGMIYFTWYLSEALTNTDVYWELEIAGKTELDLTTLLGY
jgi:hypothetical protein